MTNMARSDWINHTVVVKGDEDVWKGTKNPDTRAENPTDLPPSDVG
jgi:hypothetical protein